MTRVTLAYQRAYTAGLARGTSHPEGDPADDMELSAQVLAQVGSTHPGDCECEKCEAILGAFHYAWSTIAWAEEDDERWTEEQRARSQVVELTTRVLAEHEPIALWKCSCGFSGRGTITNAVEHRVYELLDALSGRVMPAFKR